MQLKTTILALCALPLVSACNLYGSDANVASKSALIQASQNYAPVYTDAEANDYESLTTTGLTGFVGNPDGTVSEIRVRVDMVEELAFISIDGGEEIVYDQINEYHTGYFNVYNDAAQWAYAYVYGYHPSWIQFGEDEGDGSSRGFFGRETAPDALPTETAIYSGRWNAQGETDTTGIYAGGQMGLALGFASGNVTGYTEGYFEAWDHDTDTFDGGSIIGGVTGTVTGSRIAGTMTVDGDATGEMDLMGAIYGDDAEYAAGGIGGSLTTDAGTQSLGGEFILYEGGGHFYD